MTRLPLTVWAFFVTAIIGIVSFPVLFSAALLLIFDRSFGTSFFLSDIFIQGEVLHYQGGSPVLFEHLFWFLGHPEVYIVLLPALGITSELLLQTLETNFWLPCNDCFYLQQCILINYCLGSPHVRIRYESFLRFSIYLYNIINCNSICSKSI